MKTLLLIAAALLLLPSCSKCYNCEDVGEICKDHPRYWTISEYDGDYIDDNGVAHSCY